VVADEFEASLLQTYRRHVLRKHEEIDGVGDGKLGDEELFANYFQPLYSTAVRQLE